MKKNNKLSLTETINAMNAANGTSILPDGKGDVLPAAIDFSAANKMRSQVPTIAAAMTSSTPMQTSGSNNQEAEEDEEIEETFENPKNCGKEEANNIFMVKTLWLPGFICANLAIRKSLVGGFNIQGIYDGSLFCLLHKVNVI